MKRNIPTYYQRPVDIEKQIEERNQAELARKEMILNMSPDERDIYYREQQLALQRKMLQAQSVSIQQQNQQIKIQNKQFGSIAKCPRCGSTSLSGQKKGYGVVKGALGSAALGAMTGGIGAIVGLGAGNIGRNKVNVTCLNCGRKFKA